MSFGGYIPKRRGILDHLRDGRLTLRELGAHDALLLLADKSSGIWIGSAKALAAHCGGGDVSERQARHILEALEKGAYIKRFPIRRSHRNYPILIDKFQVTFGAYSGMRLNAGATRDWRRPVYESCLEHGVEQGVEHGVEQGVERASNREGDRRPRPETIITPVEKLVRTRTDDSPFPLFEGLKPLFPGLTPRQFDFAVERISSRAKTPPRSLGFWQKSLPSFFSAETFSGEIESFLAGEAFRLLAQGERSLASLAEDLKCAAAGYDLPYSGLTVDRAIESAVAQHERGLELMSEIGVGGKSVPKSLSIVPLQTTESAPASLAVRTTPKRFVSGATA